MERLTQKQREQELAVIVQNSLAALLSKLDSEERKTSRTKGSTPPRTFEDKARAIAESPRDPRAAVVRASLSAFQNAVNALWVFSIEHRLPERLAATWVRKHRADAAPLAREDVEAEVMFALRHQIIRYCAGTDAGLESFATRGVHQHLTEWVAQQGPVELPQRVARKQRPRGYRQGLGGPVIGDSQRENTTGMHFDSKLPEKLMTENPEDYLIAGIDGAVTEEDL